MIKLICSVAACLLTLFSLEDSSLARTFKQALPGYKFSFPFDHRSHEDYKTEWWYYTGHLTTSDQKSFGYELTFFRTATDDFSDSGHYLNASPWLLKNIYLAHFAISDEADHRFKFYEKLNRAGVNFASASDKDFRVTNENWSATERDGKMCLDAETPEFGLHLDLEPSKPPVVHGQDGVSQKADCLGCASHYYSISRLKTEGILLIDKVPVAVRGESWMDHEFGSNQLTSQQVGWDWFSIQLDNNIELMLYVMRNADGSQDRNSSGTVVFGNGAYQHLKRSDFVIKSSSVWKSSATQGAYPMGWHISIPRLKAELDISPVFPEQELVTKRSTGVTYWEGSSTVRGEFNAARVNGRSYVEMTGYAERFRQNI